MLPSTNHWMGITNLPTGKLNPVLLFKIYHHILKFTIEIWTLQTNILILPTSRIKVGVSHSHIPWPVGSSLLFVIRIRFAITPPPCIFSLDLDELENRSQRKVPCGAATITYQSASCIIFFFCFKICQMFQLKLPWVGTTCGNLKHNIPFY